MDWHEIADDWEEYSKKAQSNWNKLTIEQVLELDGSYSGLNKLIQSHYQYDAAESEAQIKLWLSNLLGRGKAKPVNDDLEQKLKENQDTIETIVERDEIVGSPFHKGY